MLLSDKKEHDSKDKKQKCTPYYSVYEIIEQVKVNCNGRNYFSGSLEVGMGGIFYKASRRNFVKKQKCSLSWSP